VAPPVGPPVPPVLAAPPVALAPPDFAPDAVPLPPQPKANGVPTSSSRTQRRVFAIVFMASPPKPVDSLTGRSSALSLLVRLRSRPHAGRLAPAGRHWRRGGANSCCTPGRSRSRVTAASDAGRFFPRFPPGSTIKVPHVSVKAHSSSGWRLPAIDPGRRLRGRWRIVAAGRPVQRHPSGLPVRRWAGVNAVHATRQSDPVGGHLRLRARIRRGQHASRRSDRSAG
jgi:hypothetical protein